MKIELNEQEVQILLNIFDLAISVGKRQVARAICHFEDKLRAASAESENASVTEIKKRVEKEK